MNKGYSIADLGICADPNSLAVGKVVLANEAAFNKTFLSQPMTDYAVGYRTEDGELENLLEFLAPSVKAPRRFEYRVANNADEFALIANDGDVRALYGEFKQVRTIGDVVNAKTVSKGLSTLIEKDSELDGEVQAKIKWLKKLLLRAEIRRATLMLDAAATNTNKTWAGSGTPDVDFMAALDAFGDAVGVDANRVLFGSTAWAKRIGNYAAQTATTFRPANTFAELADFLGVEEVRKSKERITSGTGKSKIVTANKVYIFQGEKGATSEDASTLKRFWTPEEGGGEWAVYIDDVTNAKVKRVTVAHTSQIATTVSAGVQTLTIS